MLQKISSNDLKIDEALHDMIGKCLVNAEKIHLTAYRDEGPFTSLAGAHCHSHWEIFAVIEGGFSFKSINQEREVFGEGSLIMVPPGCPHTLATTIEQPEKQKICILSLPDESEFNGTFSWMLGGGKTVNLNAFTSSTVSRWNMIAGITPKELFIKIAKALQNGSWGRELACAMIRMSLASLGESLSDSENETDNGLLDHRIIKVLAILQKEYHNPVLSIDSLAADTGLSKAHLFDLFKNVTGNTIHQTLIEIRLRRAMEFLEEGRYSVKEIAGMTGWRSQLYFSSAFRKHYGSPPSMMRGKSK